MIKQSNKVYVLLAAMLGVTVLAGAVVMVPGAQADDISPIDDEITITVDSACTMGQTTLSSNPTLNPGETNTIGTSRIAAYCNDSNGYDIYAIGYANGEYSNTAMQSADGGYTIPTGLSGTASYWNMRLAPGTATGSTSYIPTVENAFLTNTTIPDDYTKVASFSSTTIPQTEDPLAYGSYIDATYEAHISTTQPAGVYIGQVQYVMVHPTGAPAPEVPPTYMQDTATIKSKLKNTGDTIQAIDNRDGKPYWIAKLADDNIWMTQNLDHNIGDIEGGTYTSADTDLPSYATWTPSDSEYTYATDDTTWNSSNTAPESYDPGNLYWDGTLNTNWDGNLSNETVSDPSATSGGTHYHIGNYYNWTAAVAMSNSSSYTSGGTDVNQSICPAGWRLPNNSDNKSYQNLVNTQGLSAGTSGNIQNTPTYFVYGGYWYGSSSYVGSNGYYWSSVVRSSYYAYLLNFRVDGNLYPQDRGRRDYGFSLRCVAR